jgi:hypothetical protein
VNNPMDEGREPLKELEFRERSFNAVRDPMDEGRGPVKELKLR